MKINRYDLYARFIPALVSSIPILLLWYHYLEYLVDLQNWIFEIKLFGGISVGLILVFVLVFISRDLSKWYQSKVFNKPGMPSEYLMLPDKHVYSASLRTKYYAQLKSLFDIQIDTDNISELKLSLKDGFKLALETVRNNELVFQQNIRYGFIRNLIGGSLIGLIGCCILLILGIIYGSFFLKLSSGIISIIYLPIILYSKVLLVKNGEAFADTVFMVFLSQKSVGMAK